MMSTPRWVEIGGCFHPGGVTKLAYAGKISKGGWPGRQLSPLDISGGVVPKKYIPFTPKSQGEWMYETVTF